jgi:hypothetical protein
MLTILIIYAIETNIDSVGLLNIIISNNKKSLKILLFILFLKKNII